MANGRMDSSLSRYLLGLDFFTDGFLLRWLLDWLLWHWLLRYRLLRYRLLDGLRRLNHSRHFFDRWW